MTRSSSPQTLAGPRLWLRAARAFSFSASLIPMALGAATAWAWGPEVRWALLPAVLLAGLLLHCATNLLNDRDDFVRGVDRPGTRGGSGLLVQGVLQPATLQRAGAVCFVVAAGLGIGLVLVRGWPLLLIGTAGMAGAWGYTAGGAGYKYRALGDPLVGILMGPLMVLGSHVALSGQLAARPALASLPVALLVVGILAANNLRDLADDRAARIRTLATVLGRRGALAWYLTLLAGACLSLLLLAATRVLPWTCLAALLAAPLALRCAVRAVRGAGGEEELYADLDLRTAQLHLFFGVLMVAGIFLGA